MGRFTLNVRVQETWGLEHPLFLGLRLDPTLNIGFSNYKGEYFLDWRLSKFGGKLVGATSVPLHVLLSPLPPPATLGSHTLVLTPSVQNLAIDQ